MRAIKKGSTSQSVVIRIVDSTDGTPETGVVFNTAGIDLWYRREGANKVSITEATLADAAAAYSSGGIVHIGDGYYRLDAPDAALAAGVNGVMFGGTVTGMVVIGCYVHLVDYDPQDSGALGLSRLDAQITSRLAPATAGRTLQIDAFGYAYADLRKVVGDVTSATAGPNFNTFFDNGGSLSSNYVGQIASQTDVLSISNNTRVRSTIPVFIERADGGAESLTFVIELYDSVGNMEVPDSTPTLALVDRTGNDLSSRISALANPSAGRYTFTYNNTVLDPAPDWLRWTLTVVEGGATRTYSYGTSVVDTTAIDFTGTDRANLTAIKAKTDNLPATPAAVGSPMTLSSAERDAVAIALLDLANAVENITIRQLFRGLAAFASGKSSGHPNNPIFRNLGDTKNVITATVDGNGNRTAVIRDFT